MAEPFGVLARSVLATHFTAVIAQNALHVEELTVQADAVVINRVTMLSQQNIEYDVFFFRTRPDAVLTDYDELDVIDWVEFPAADAKRIAGAGPFIYSRSNMHIRVAAGTTLFVGLVPRSAAGKLISGGGGDFTIEIGGVRAAPDFAAQTPEV